MCRHFTETLDSTPGAPARARSLLHDRLDEWEVVDRDGDATLLVSELTTNAVVHGAGPIEIIIAVANGTLEVGVFDANPKPPAHRQDAGEVAPRSEWLAEDGRGLRLVDAVADEWGVEQRRVGKQVWFRIDVERDWPYRGACPCNGANLACFVRLGSGAAAVSVPPPWNI